MKLTILNPVHLWNLVREALVCRREIDPIALQALDAEDPWETYRAAMEAGGRFMGGFRWMPDGGALYVQWMELTDLFDHPRSVLSPEEAQEAVRVAARAWLARPRWNPLALSRWASQDFSAGAYPGT